MGENCMEDSVRNMVREILGKTKEGLEEHGLSEYYDIFCSAMHSATALESKRNNYITEEQKRNIHRLENEKEIPKTKRSGWNYSSRYFFAFFGKIFQILKKRTYKDRHFLFPCAEH